MKFVRSSRGALIKIPSAALRHIQFIHGTGYYSSNQRRQERPSFFTIGNWKKVIYETIERGQVYHFGQDVIYRLSFAYDIGNDSRAGCYVNVAHICTRNGTIITAYPRQDFIFD